VKSVSVAILFCSITFAFYNAFDAFAFEGSSENNNILAQCINYFLL